MAFGLSNIAKMLIDQVSSSIQYFLYGLVKLFSIYLYIYSIVQHLETVGGWVGASSYMILTPLPLAMSLNLAIRLEPVSWHLKLSPGVDRPPAPVTMPLSWSFNFFLQATMADNRTVDRARAWCSTCGIVYQRLSPQLSLDVQLDERQDEIIINALWETMVYIRSKKYEINRLGQLLALGCPQT